MTARTEILIPFDAILGAFIDRLERAVPDIATDGPYTYLIGHHVTEAGLVIEIERVGKERDR